MKVAIDGPAGAGKSVIARAVSKRLGFIYVDTGALYRGIGLYALRKGADTEKPEEIEPLLQEIDERLVFEDGEQHVVLNGEDVSAVIRTEAVSKAASDVSAIPSVRKFLFDMQRSIAETNDVIMDGRDIGTVVLPDAELKVFLTAAPEIRAKRRVAQLAEKGIDAKYEDVLEEIKVRDYNDSHRETAPLKQADDAVYIDNSGISLEDDIDNMTKLVSEAKCRLG